MFPSAGLQLYMQIILIFQILMPTNLAATRRKYLNNSFQYRRILGSLSNDLSNPKFDAV